MTRALALLALLASLAVSPASLPAQRQAQWRAGVAVAPPPADTVLPPRRNFFAPPPSEQVSVAAGYIGLMSGIAAGAFAASNNSRDCRGCATGLAAVGSILGSGVGAKMAASALRCEHDNFRARSAVSGLLAGSAALLALRSSSTAGQWTAIIGFPVATTYFVGGCETR